MTQTVDALPVFCLDGPENQDSDEFPSMDSLVTGYYDRLITGQESLLQQLANRISHLKSTVDTETILGNDFCKPGYLQSVDPSVEAKVTDAFNKLMQDIERKAKQLESVGTDECESLSVHDLIAQHRLQRKGMAASPRLSTSQRRDVYALIKQAQSESMDDQTEDQASASSVSYQKAPRIHFIRGTARRLGRPPLKGSRWRKFIGSRADSGKLWPSAEHGLFCLLRGFLTQGGERRRLNTAQLCEYVREWQTQVGLKLKRLGGSWSWISRSDDWAAITPYALQFLTADAMPSSSTGASAGIIRHSSRRLVCPRPFVDPKHRVHQWLWLLSPPSSKSSATDNQSIKFENETQELSALFNEWLRAPRGLGGFSDAELLSSATVVSGIGRRRRKRKVGLDDGHGDDSEDSEQSRRLRITSDFSGSDDEALNHPKGRSSAKYSDGKTGGGAHRRSYILDDSVPPPFCPTTWKLRPFTEEEVTAFRSQEAQRFARPWLPFVYRIQNYESIVGPLRSAPSASSQSATSSMSLNQSTQVKARDHPLLRPDRPMYVSLAEIVRDAVACLPNGEGTRADITTLVQNSGFLLPFVDQRKLQQCVSSALDRLQGEAADPSVYFNAAHRVWVYRHRYRTLEEFAELHEARCAVNETKRSLQRGEMHSTSANVYGPSKFRGPRISAPAAYRSESFAMSSRPNYSGRPVEYSGYGQMSRHRYPPHSELPFASPFEEEEEEDYESDSHIPDIEELEAADRLRHAQGDVSVYSEQSSFYDEREDEEADEEEEEEVEGEEGDLDYDFGSVQEEQLIAEPMEEYTLDDGNGLYSTSFRGPLRPRRVFTPAVHSPNRFRSGYDNRGTFNRHRVYEGMSKRNRSLR